MTDDDDPQSAVIAKLLSKGLSPAAISNLLDVDYDTVVSVESSRDRPTLDVEEMATGLSQYVRRAFDEGMMLLDEGSPAIKLRLIQGAMGHVLRLMNTQSPKELDNMRDEMAELMHSVSTDDTDVESIYSAYPESPVHYDPSSIPEDMDDRSADA